MRTAEVVCPELVFTLIGPGWSARLLVGQPEHADPERLAFAVPAIEDDPAPQRIEADVDFSAAENLTADSGGWRKWHVKIYRCAEQGNAANC